MKSIRTVIAASLLMIYLPAHAASFDCSRGRSPTERLICDDPALSALDDTLGQLYRQVRHSLAGAQRRAFSADSDTKWAWREANCTDLACLNTWYVGRIAELQRSMAGMQTEALMGTSADAPGNRCTAAEPGIVLHDQCPTVLRQNARWQYTPRSAPIAGDWFCGVATLSAADSTR